MNNRPPMQSPDRLEPRRDEIMAELAAANLELQRLMAGDEE